MNVLGLKIVAHDPGAALISNDKVVAISEERLNRIKHSNDVFPEKSIWYCLTELAVLPEDLDLIVIDQIFSPVDKNMVEIFRAWDTKNIFRDIPISVINHHDAHAASAFLCSPFQEAAIFICDGSGEMLINQFGVPAVETESLYRGEGNTLVCIQKNTHARIDGRFPKTWGIGRFYAFISSKYIGLGQYNEGKMMGLAPYGDDSFLKTIPRSEWYKENHGNMFINAQIKYPHGGGKTHEWNLEWFMGALVYKMRQPLEKFTRWISLKVFSQQHRFVANLSMFKPIRLPRPARNPSIDTLPDKYYTSVAYAAQKILEEVTCWWATRLRMITGLENIAIAGGVGLNIDANRNYLDKAGFSHIWIQPGASDSGVPLGCALYGYNIQLKQPRVWEMKSAALGRLYSEGEILKALERFGDKVTWVKSEDVCKETAGFLAQRKIVGWFHGGSEYGPRALGNRSILMDARGKDARDILNNRVKHREPWRPFAASVLESHMSEWFELTEQSRFMLLAAQVVVDKIDMIPSVVHVDGTCRIQSVIPESNQRYHQLLTEFYKATGVPLLLNTSFNLGGDPIIESPHDALDTFTRTEMDYLILEDYIVSKK